MQTKIIIRIAVYLLSILLLSLAGCGGKPFHYNPPSEIPEGPGVLSGKDGDFTLYDSKSVKGRKKSVASTEAGAPATEKSGATVVTGDKMPDSNEYREFQNFQEWKNSEQDSKEYQEFQEWIKWKAFKKWQKNQQ